jgi:hypothetical protein
MYHGQMSVRCLLAGEKTGVSKISRGSIVKIYAYSMDNVRKENSWVTLCISPTPDRCGVTTKRLYPFEFKDEKVHRTGRGDHGFRLQFSVTQLPISCGIVTFREMEGANVPPPISAIYDNTLIGGDNCTRSENCPYSLGTRGTVIENTMFLHNDLRRL